VLIEKNKNLRKIVWNNLFAVENILFTLEIISVLRQHIAYQFYLSIFDKKHKKCITSIHNLSFALGTTFSIVMFYWLMELFKLDYSHFYWLMKLFDTGANDITIGFERGQMTISLHSWFHIKNSCTCWWFSFKYERSRKIRIYFSRIIIPVQYLSFDRKSNKK
jgi:hypothetical protein